MGLLDQLGNLDPEQTQGLLAAAAQMLQQSGPSTRPMGIGQIFGGGLQAYQGGLDQARQRQMEQAQQAQMGQMRGLQIQEHQGLLHQRQIEQELQDRISGAARDSYQTPEQQASSLAGGPTIANAARIPEMGGGFDQNGFINRVMQIDPLKGMELRKQLAKAGTEFDTKPQVGIGPDGKPFTYILGKDGTQKRLDGTLPRDEMKLANLGGRDVAYNPYALQVGQTFQRTQSPDSIASNGVTIRGQNMTDARAREANANAAGNKAPTEFQGKSAAYGLRASEADKILNGLAGKYNPSAINSKTQVEDWPIIGGMAGAAANMALSDSDQQAEQAQRDFVNAVLRQESGAAIGAPEFSNAKKQYFPQPGDSAAVITQKARNRQLAIQGLETNAGRARMTAPPDAAGGSGWKIERAD